MPIQLDMMTKLIATAIFAGVVAILATVVIERLGGKLGGILATIPTTIVPASFGFWFLSNQPTEFENALWSVPAGMLLNAAFLHSWHWMPKMIMVTHRWLKLCLVIACSLSLWLVLAIMSVIVLERLIDFMPIVGISSLVIQVVYGYMASRAHRAKYNFRAAVVTRLLLVSEKIRQDEGRRAPPLPLQVTRDLADQRCEARRKYAFSAQRCRLTVE